MPKSVSRIRTPEDDELDRKQEELRAREAVLVEKELELSNLQAELLQFRGLYIMKVGWLQVELDLLRAERLRRLAIDRPEDAEAERRAQEAERKAENSRAEYTSAQSETAPFVNRVESSAELKEAYRRLAKTYHPDLADEVEDVARRTAIMAKINAAYAAGDLEAMLQVDRDAEMAPEAVKGHDLPSQMQRLLRKIYQVGRRIEEVEERIRQTMLGDDWRLYVEWKQAREWGIDILEKMARKLRSKIAAERAMMEEMDAGGVVHDLRCRRKVATFGERLRRLFRWRWHGRGKK